MKYPTYFGELKLPKQVGLQSYRHAGFEMGSPAVNLPNLNKYELIEELGHGGMASVYRARDKRLGREVALKLIHRHLREHAEVGGRFLSEARAVAMLKHANIVQVFDVSDESEAERYLVVELIQGCSLRQWLDHQTRPLPPELAGAIVLEIAGALQHAHEAGVVHRDVKPENVLLDLLGSGPREAQGSISDTIPDALPLASEKESNSPISATKQQIPRAARQISEPNLKKSGGQNPARIKLTDFGIAKLLDVPGMTATGQVLGSPAHMAPEQIEGHPVDVRADIFALGVLFYETLTGALPFIGRNPAQTMRAVLSGDYVPATHLVPKIGQDWASVVDRALATKPEDRYSSVAEMADAIRKLRANLGYTDERAEVANLLGNNSLSAANEASFFDEKDEEIAKRLSEAARRFQNDGQAVEALKYLSRALAYHPGDAELLELSRGLGRSARSRRWLAQSATIVLILASAALVFAIVWQNWPDKKQENLNRSDETLANHGGFSVGETTAEDEQEPTFSSADDEPVALDEPAKGVDDSVNPDENLAEQKPAGAPAGSRKPMNAPKPSATASSGMRQVVVRITGASGGKLLIDGVERSWFGDQKHTLTLGDHSFTFVPPDDECCVAQNRVVRITAGEAEQLVVGRIAFRPASLSLQGTEGAKLLCPTLYAGALTVPGAKVIPLSKPDVFANCTVESGSNIRSQRLKLRAGQQQVLSL